jgi:hypothetical protein
MPALAAPESLTVVPGSRMDLLLRWYQNHPGYHRCMDVGAVTDLPTHRVAVVSRRLNEAGVIDRRQVKAPGRATPVTLYGIPVDH